jgi:hypothetical protein
MAKIKASLAEISTEFKPLEPGLYRLEITKVEEIEKNGVFVAYRIASKVVGGEFDGKPFSEYIHIRKPDEEINPEAIGLATVKRYFEVTHGKATVAEWSDDDFDTDLLIGKQFEAQVKIESYTKEGETEARKSNRIVRMEEV